MNIEEFKIWLEETPNDYKNNYIEKIISNCKKVERYYKDLDIQFNKDKGDSINSLLNYSIYEQRNNIQPKHIIPINGEIRTGSVTLKRSFKLYMQFCDFNNNETGIISELLKNDLNDINNNDELNQEQKSILVKYRLGQSEFRKKLINYWGGCSVCACKNTDILISSHIKPWIECDEDEKYDLYNGLLLTPNYDKLFNNCMITFDEIGMIIISDSLSEDDLVKLNISRNDRISPDKLTLQHQVYLEEHRVIFNKNKII